MAGINAVGAHGFNWAVYANAIQMPIGKHLRRNL
jgi:hypothetical protein